MFDKKQKSFVKCIHLVTDDGLYDQKVFYTVKKKIILRMMAKLSFIKSVLNPLHVNLFIRNSPKSFQNTHSFPCWLSDHHNLVVIVLKNTWKAKI